MASAAAAHAADPAPRLPDDPSDDDEYLTGKIGPVGDDEAEEEESPRDTVEENGLNEEEDDLFGDGGEDDEEPATMRKLDDEELDSGDDEDRVDRVPPVQDVEVEAEEHTFSFMDADIARHCVPEPSDGELYLFKVPRFLSIEPTAFSHKTFQAPTTDHHSRIGPTDHFSPYDTAMTTVRWRRSPTNPAQLQSNARVLRWSDGSLTFQFASQPLDHYEINANLLAPPQINPKKPTPTSISHKTAQEYKQSYSYLVAPYEVAQVMRVTNKFTTSLSVVPTATSKDGALEVLQNALAKAANRGRDERDQAISFINVEEDPELKRAKEEAQFKLKQKQARAREKIEMREREKQSRSLGGSGRSSGYGLSTDLLEGAEGGRRGGARKPRKKSGLGRGWSSDEEFGRGGQTREDEYDEEDDFIARTDEEEEGGLDDDDEEEILDDPSPKRNRHNDDDDDEVAVSRTKRRRVVDDDDDDE